MGPDISEELIEGYRRKSEDENSDAEKNEDNQRRWGRFSVFDNFSHFLHEENKLSLVLVSLATIDNKADSLETFDFLFGICVLVE